MPVSATSSVTPPRCHWRRGHVDAAARPVVLDGVVDQVHQHFAQFAGVRGDGEAVRPLDAEGDAVDIGQWSADGDTPVHHVAHFDLLGPHRVGPGVQPREREHPLDELVHLPGDVPAVFNCLPVLGRRPRFPARHFQSRGHRRQWRAQFVGNVSGGPLFPLERLLEFVQRQFEPVHHGGHLGGHRRRVKGHAEILGADLAHGVRKSLQWVEAEAHQHPAADERDE